MKISLISNDGRPLLSIGGVQFHNAWRVLKERIAEEHRIHESDMDEAIRIEEDEDSIEWCTINGERVGYVVTSIMGLTFGEPANRNDDPAQAGVREVMESAS